MSGSQDVGASQHKISIPEFIKILTEEGIPVTKAMNITQKMLAAGCPKAYI
jgi:hypothetical protein